MFMDSQTVVNCIILLLSGRLGYYEGKVAESKGSQGVALFSMVCS